MLAFYDTESLERALSLPPDAKLHRLLTQRVDHFNALDFDVRDVTYYIIVTAETRIGDIVDELDWSPLVNPLNDVAFGSEGFVPFHDYLVDRGGWFELLVHAGNDAVFVLLIEDADGAEPDLLAFCRAYVDEPG